MYSSYFSTSEYTQSAIRELVLILLFKVSMLSVF